MLNKLENNSSRGEQNISSTKFSQRVVILVFLLIGYWQYGTKKSKIT
jgi:hypothetical protein